MATLSVILTIVSVLTAILLTILVLIQNPKGQGGIGAISGGVSEAMFGASAPSALVKITVVLAIVFLLSTLFNVAINGHLRKQKSIGETIVVETTPATPAVEAGAEAEEAPVPADAAVEAVDAPAAADAAAPEATPAPEAPAAE